MEPDKTAGTPQVWRILLEPRLLYHRRCLREDATNPDLTELDRLTLVRDRVGRMREIEQEVEVAKDVDAVRSGDDRSR